MGDSKFTKLKLYFKQNGITQLEIAKRLNVSQPYVGNVLSGKTALGINAAKKWSEEFNINLVFLLTGEGEIAIAPPAEEKAVIANANNDVQNTAAPDSAEYWRGKYEECLAQLQHERGICEGLRMALGLANEEKKGDVG